MEDAQLKSIIEALLFVSESPLSLERIKEILGEGSKKEVQRILGMLLEDYERNPRGFFLVEVAEGFQLRTRPEYAEWIKKLKKTKPLAFSQAALETLAIIAYKQPIVRADLEKIRGVDSGGVLRTLLEKKLIKILGKKDVPGKPLVYGTSKHFLETFGLKELSNLPTLKDIEGLGPLPAEEVLFPETTSPPGQKSGSGEGAERAAAQETIRDESMDETAKDSFPERDDFPAKSGSPDP